MHTRSVSDWRHEHLFLGENHAGNERRTWTVVALTATMMAVEIAAGAVFGSMSLLADGWHMSTHAAALAIAAVAYRVAHTHEHDPRLSFGTAKLGELAGFASAIILALIALLIAYESVLRLAAPLPIRFDEAIIVAAVGLCVNLASAWLLAGGTHHHGHDPHHHHDDHQHHHAHDDSNLRAAYLHVLADALTSVLAIVALLAGRFFGWIWVDPVVGVVGALVIAYWSWGLIRSSGAVLLDAVPDRALAERIRDRIEIAGDRVADLHLWRLGPGHSGLILSVISDRPQPPDTYKRRLAGLGGLSHVTVEVHACSDQPTQQAAA